MDRMLRSAGVLALAVGITTGEAQAQTPVTFVAGPTFADVRSDDVETTATTGLFLMVGTTFPVNERLSVEPFVGYVGKGTEFDDGTGRYHFAAVRVLLTAAVPLGSSAQLQAGLGPQLAFNVRCRENRGGEEVDCSSFANFKATEMAVAGTVGVNFPVGEGRALTVGGGLDLGFTTMFGPVPGETASAYKTRNLFAFLAFRTILGP